MLPSLRRRPTVQRADATGNFWAGDRFNASRALAGGRNPMALPAFYRGLAHRVGILSTLPLVPTVDGKPAGVPVEVLDQPDPTEDRQTTISRLEASLILRGEYVMVLGSFDDDGFPRAVKVIDPSKARLEPDGWWTIGTRRFSPGEVLHYMPLALPGETRGVSVVELFRRTFTGELAAAEYQSNFYLDGAQATTILYNSDPEATPADIEGQLAKYMSKLAGGRREPIGLPDTVKVDHISLSNADSQFLESRQFAIVDIANIVGVPPYLVGAPGSSNVYSNQRDQNRYLLELYLRSSVYAIERGFSTLLPDGLTARFDVTDFLRMDPKGQADTMAVEAQWSTLNELRARAGLEPLPGGDVIAAQYAPGSTSPAATGGRADAL